ncbi:uncharacterized protein LOC108097889 [Drosophila ficusphila]|uniref:uncharacterized protein LOC108097889 n=1 Tax=Drosophila ficusphila TaxID=30025 RepID=UPI0007E8921F|nr:uncharacterized protein LOC108097889 [Drosophila ficusphila]
MFRRGLKVLKTRPFTESFGILCREISGFSRRKAKFVKRPPLNQGTYNFNWPTLQRITDFNNVDGQDKKRYSTLNLENSRSHELWQKSRVRAKEQNSLRGYQPANSDATSDSEEITSALDKVRRIEERRKIQNKMQSLMQEQELIDQRIQDEHDRQTTKKEVLVEREPVKEETPMEYAPVRTEEIPKPGPWVSATVLAATGNNKQQRYMQRPQWLTNKVIQNVPNSQSSSYSEILPSSSKSAQIDVEKPDSRSEWAKTAMELHKSRAMEMDKQRTETEYTKESACLKLTAGKKRIY